MTRLFESYLVYGRGGKVVSCGSIKPLSKAGADLEALGAESTPKGRPGVNGERLPETSGSPPGLLLPIAAALLGGGFAAAFIKLLSGGRYGG